MKGKRGQSMIEMLFSVAVVVLVLSGVVALLVSSFGARNKSVDRKKAVYVAEKLMDRMVSEKENSPNSFWTMTTRSGTEEGYGYSITLGSDNKCSNPQVCKEILIEINIDSGDNQKVELRRLFIQ